MDFLFRSAQSRREFFRATARYGLLSLLTVAAALTTRNRRLSGQRCVNEGICNRCPQLTGCGLPAALSIKRSTSGV